MLFKSWTSHFYALLIHPTESKILLEKSNNNYNLPLVKSNQGIWLDNFQAIKDLMEQELGIAVNVLHYASYQIDKRKRKIQGIYVLEQQNLTETTKKQTWYDRVTLNNLPFADPQHKSIIQEYLLEIENKTFSELRPPWTKAGWFNEVCLWIEEELAKLGYQQLAPVEYVKSWSISCILKVKTTAGNIYFKQASTLPLFCNEPVVTTELANLFPQHIPTVISIDRQRHWMLLKDFGELIKGNVSLKVQQDIYRLLAQIHIKSIKQKDHLLNIGCLDRSLNCLQSQIEPLFNDKNVLSQLSSSEIKQLQHLIPCLKSLCCELADYNIPETLVHGDLHLGNVVFKHNNYLFFDWTDSCISHPFFDLFQLFFEHKSKSFLGNFESFWLRKNQKYLRDRYLSQWLEFEPQARLLKAWSIAKPLCALHHAVTYQYIINSLETRSKQEFYTALPRFLTEIIPVNHEKSLI